MSEQDNGTAVEEKRRDVFLSRASSRKELAATIHDLVIPELQRLGGNDKVTQQVCKATIEGIKAQGEEIVRISQRLAAVETMSFGARLRWAFTFSPKKKESDGTGTAAPDRDAAAAGTADTGTA